MNSNDALSKFTEIIYDYWKEKKYNEIASIIIFLLCFFSLSYMYLFLYNIELFLSVDFLKLFCINIFLNSGFFIIIYSYNDYFYKKLKSICGKIEDKNSYKIKTEEELSIEINKIISLWEPKTKYFQDKFFEYKKLESDIQNFMSKVDIDEESELSEELEKEYQNIVDSIDIFKKEPFIENISILAKETEKDTKCMAILISEFKKDNAFIETLNTIIITLSTLYIVYFIKIIFSLSVIDSNKLIIISSLIYLIKDSFKKINFIIRYNKIFHKHDKDNLKLLKIISKIKIYLFIIIFSIISTLQLLNILNIN